MPWEHFNLLQMKIRKWKAYSYNLAWYSYGSGRQNLASAYRQPVCIFMIRCFIQSIMTQVLDFTLS